MELYIRKIKGERNSEKTFFKAVATGGVFSLLMGCGAKKEETAEAKVKDDKLSGSKPAKLAGAGEYPVGVSMIYSDLKEKPKGVPIEVALPKEGLGWEVEANALIKKDNAKNDKIAKAFLDLAITDDVVKLYFEKNGFATIKNDYKL